MVDADENELDGAMDWLLARQDTVQKKFAARHLSEGGLVLYDLSSRYFEGATCPLGQERRQAKRKDIDWVSRLVCRVVAEPECYSSRRSRFV